MAQFGFLLISITFSQKKKSYYSVILKLAGFLSEKVLKIVFLQPMNWKVLVNRDVFDIYNYFMIFK